MQITYHMIRYYEIYDDMMYIVFMNGNVLADTCSVKRTHEHLFTSYSHRISQES